MIRAISLDSISRDYIALTKPKIALLLVFTCVTSMVVAADAFPSLDVFAFTVLGGALSAGGASALNQYLDRELDAKMARTGAASRCPLAAYRRGNALIFGWALVAWSVFVFGLFVNWLAAGLALAGALYYVVIYTMVLKRNTVVNILIGGGRGRYAGAGRLGGGNRRPSSRKPSSSSRLSFTGRRRIPGPWRFWSTKITPPPQSR